jgi:hypothetical protein
LIYNIYFGQTLDNLGKDIRTAASGVVGVGDSAQVYAVSSFTNYH